MQFESFLAIMVYEPFYERMCDFLGLSVFMVV